MPLNELVFFSFLNKLNNFEDRPQLAVGVSGGPDSMALVYLINKWIKIKKGSLIALIFDHGIRTESKEESLIVKKILTKMKIEAVIIKPKKNNVIKKNMANARDNRFEGMINYCTKKRILHLFLGHHLDDNLETFLIRKINGSNLDGLESINKIAYFKKIEVLRPLLETTKSSIISFNRKNNISYINDPSNKDINYTRIKVRNFLQNKSYKTIIKNDFLKIKKQIPDYKRMVWETCIKCLVDVTPSKIKINFKNFTSLDDLIIEKHTLSLLKFFSKSNNKTKSSKIMIFIDLLKKSSFKTFNLSGVIIKKNVDLLVFYKNS